ncbi:MAG: hypothetical protein J6D03_09590 [Clostridia bacterium]|nr:hypothetical protein [Clostridia bacterium]
MSIKSVANKYFKTLVNNAVPNFNNALINAANSTAGLIYGSTGGTGRVDIDREQLFGDDSNENLSGKAFNSTIYDGVYNKQTSLRENADGIHNNYDVSHPYSDDVNIRIMANNEGDAFETSIGIPRWGYKDFLNERVSWQKSLDSLTGEPGWFYFKIFFKFDTNYGLFPGILDNGGTRMMTQNSAMNYLSNISHIYENNYNSSFNRKVALRKFVKTLSWINSYAPWFFKKITGMDQASYLDLNEITKEKFIEIECLQDAVDMRLTTLMDLYRYVCYDNIKQKEILPENLRKFDMSVVIFHTPLRYYHSAGKSLTSKSFPYKSLHADEMGDRMSFRMVTFSECEFDLASMTAIPNELNNETAFNLAQNKIKINYNRAMVTDLNEWFKFMYSENGGFLWDQDKDSWFETMYVMRENDMNPIAERIMKHTSPYYASNGSQQNRIKAIKYAIDHKLFYNPYSTNYKALIDASEDIINNSMRLISPDKAFGNIYGAGTHANERKNKVTKTKNHSVETYNVLTDYMNQHPVNQYQKPRPNVKQVECNGVTHNALIVGGRNDNEPQYDKPSNNRGHTKFTLNPTFGGVR